LIFIVLFVVSGIFVRRDWWDTAGWLLFFNIVHNVYPGLSLRSVRARVDRLPKSRPENADHSGVVAVEAAVRLGRPNSRVLSAGRRIHSEYCFSPWRPCGPTRHEGTGLLGDLSIDSAARTIERGCLNVHGESEERCTAWADPKQR
jgi:hypothetical protein